MSRADLARTTGATRVTVSDLVSELLDEGLVEELGTRTEQRPGKPATLVGFVPDARVIASADLSDDSQFRFALANLAGKVLVRHEVDRQDRTGAEAIDLVAESLVSILEQADRPVLGIGVGSPGVVQPEGVVLEAPNLGWFERDLASILAIRLGAGPVHVANDANAAALGELSLGGPPGRSLLLVKVGHGVGAGLVIDGHLVVGERFAAGEIGHVVADAEGEQCVCGRRGCLEAAIAAPLLRKRLAAASAGRDDAPALAEKAVLSQAGGLLGRVLAPVVGALNLREVVLSGPLDVLGDTFRRSALSAMQHRTMPAVGESVDVRLTQLGEDDVLLGAAMLVLDQELGIA